MKTIVLGYSDGDGRGEAVLVHGPSEPSADQVKTVHLAKTENKFPKGLARLEFCLVQPKTVAIELPKEKPSKKEKE